MALTFSNRRNIAGGDHRVKTRWLEGVDLSPLDRRQLLGVLHLFNSSVTEEQLLAGDTTFFFDEVQGFSECPVERWDIGEGEPQFQLWICFADSGYLFDAGTTNLRANIIQWAFDIDEQIPEPLRRDIGEAAVRAIKNAQDSLLAEVSFDVE